MSISIRSAFASIALSKSSLTTDAGRSMISPAAILFDMYSGKIVILGIIIAFHSNHI